ncbi:MAG: GNAT family protein [Caldisericia bacterium]
MKLFIAWAKDENGNLIGISELVTNPNNPARLITALTGVSKEYRNKGLCKRMKTELLLYARENLPEAKYILTSSNSDNTVMLAINQKLGFEFEKPSRGYVYKTEEMKKKLGII